MAWKMLIARSSSTSAQLKLGTESATRSCTEVGSYKEDSFMARAPLSMEVAGEAAVLMEEAAGPGAGLFRACIVYGLQSARCAS